MKRSKQKYLENSILKVFIEVYFLKLNKKNPKQYNQWAMGIEFMCAIMEDFKLNFMERVWLENLIRFFITPFQKCHYINDHQIVWALWGESLCILVLPIVDSLLAGVSWGSEKSFPCGH